MTILFFLSFKNELELYSGFNRTDSDFLERIYKKTQKQFDPIIARFSQDGSVDQNLKRKIQDAIDFKKTIQSLIVSNPLKAEIKDELYDKINPLDTNSEVHKKEIFDPTFVNYEILEKYLLILSRVFKNLDGISDSELIKTVFNYLLECYCNLGFYLIEEFENAVKTENINFLNVNNGNSDDIIGEEILNLLSRIIPILIQTSLYEGVGHKNIQRIVDAKITELQKTPGDNQYKLFLLYFLYIDIDIKGNKDKIDILLNTIKLSPLKVSLIVKLNFYLAFKCYKKQELEQFLKNKIQIANLQLDDGTNVGELQKMLHQKSRKSTYSRRRMQ